MFGVEVKFAFVGVISRSRGVFVREWLGGSVTKALVGANAVVESALGHSDIPTLQTARAFK